MDATTQEEGITQFRAFLELSIITKIYTNIHNLSEKISYTVLYFSSINAKRMIMNFYKDQEIENTVCHWLCINPDLTRG